MKEEESEKVGEEIEPEEKVELEVMGRCRWKEGGGYGRG